MSSPAPAPRSAGLKSERRLRVTVVSHSYNEPGRLEPFAVLGSRVDLNLIGPRGHGDAELRPGRFSKQQHDVAVTALRWVRVSGSQYFLLGLGKVLRSTRPDVDGARRKSPGVLIEIPHL